MCISANLNLINSVVSKIIEKKVLFNSFSHIYLFGSILGSDNIPNDIDILLLYDTFADNIIDDFVVINKEFESIEELFVDFIALSITEEREAKFLDRQNFKYLRIK